MRTLEITTDMTLHEIKEDYDDIGLYLALRNGIALTETFQVNFKTKQLSFSMMFLPIYGTTQ